jgi:predicted transcriptional regulator with HTH domain
MAIKKEDYLFILFLFIIFSFSSLIGRLSPDSIDYLIMANIGDAGYLCSKNGAFYGVFPCGYPILIKTIALFINDNLFLASKTLNILILSVYYIVLCHVFKSKKLAILLTLMPFHVFISTYTWSENAILLSFGLYILALHRINKTDGVDIQSFLVVFFAILIGCLSRYAFAPFSALLFLSSFFVIGKHCMKILPVFVLNALIFLIYKYFAYGTDMERISAPEDVAWLFLVFGYVGAKLLLSYLVVYSPLIFLYRKSFTISRVFSIKNSNWSMFFIMAGIGYLTLSFVLRTLVQYDMYDERTIGFGLTLVFSGLFVAFKEELSKVSFLIIVVILFLSQITPRHVYFSELALAVKEGPLNISDVNKFIDQQQNVIDDIVITFGENLTDNVKPLVSITEYNLREGGSRVGSIPSVPYYRKMDEKDFLESLSGAKCQFVFPENLSKKELQDSLSLEYKVGIGRMTQAISPELQLYVMNKFINKDSNCY